VAEQSLIDVNDFLLQQLSIDSKMPFITAAHISGIFTGDDVALPGGEISG